MSWVSACEATSQPSKTKPETLCMDLVLDGLNRTDAAFQCAQSKQGDTPCVICDMRKDEDCRKRYDEAAEKARAAGEAEAAQTSVSPYWGHGEVGQNWLDPIAQSWVA